MPTRDEVARQCARASHWPLPAAGRTRQRWSALAALASSDLVTARLVEAHADAVAILAELAELAEPAEPSATCWGVWAAEVPGHAVTARPGADGWCLAGTKQWCSGATLLTHALLTATAEPSVAGEADTEPGRAPKRRLFAVALDDPGVRPGPLAWASAGLWGSDTRAVRFAAVPARPIGGPGDYLDRPGFWIGGIGVAACWYGGATGVADPLRRRVAAGGDPHAAAHLGGVEVALGSARDALRCAADAVDTAPRADHSRLARRVRATVAEVAAVVLTRVGRALGPAPLAGDPAHAQRVADLEVYIRQDHAERDLAELGVAVAAGDPGWQL
ncbi:acyl-CoA dehydrogenase [Frankia sp. AgPm24]|uniref:acyl-CoA dehydrogenase n=1 Tax=Frankia sp. AgPm24 TaxID=631128 RepID=UPI002035972D